MSLICGLMASSTGSRLGTVTHDVHSEGHSFVSEPQLYVPISVCEPDSLRLTAVLEDVFLFFYFFLLLLPTKSASLPTLQIGRKVTHLGRAT